MKHTKPVLFFILFIIIYATFTIKSFAVIDKIGVGKINVNRTGQQFHYQLLPIITDDYSIHFTLNEKSEILAIQFAYHNFLLTLNQLGELSHVKVNGDTIAPSSKNILKKVWDISSNQYQGNIIYENRYNHSGKVIKKITLTGGSNPLIIMIHRKVYGQLKSQEMAKRLKFIEIKSPKENTDFLASYYIALTFLSETSNQVSNISQIRTFDKKKLIEIKFTPMNRSDKISQLYFISYFDDDDDIIRKLQFKYNTSFRLSNIQSAKEKQSKQYNRLKIIQQGKAIFYYKQKRWIRDVKFSGRINFYPFLY